MDEDVSKPAGLRDLNDEMLQLSKAERRLRWKHYLAKVTNLGQKSTIGDRAQKCRLFAEGALHEAETAPLETRDDYLHR